MVSLVSPASLTEWSIALIGVIGAIGGLQCIRDIPPPPPVVELPPLTREEVESNV
jgi:hypothetical protein